MTPERIAFVHIPKTGGRSVVHAFEQALGAARCVAFAPRIDAALFTPPAQFVSGHVQLSQIVPDAFAFTFLRHPLAQLVSHLRWLDRYNDPVFREEVVPFSASLRAAITRVGQTDFGSAASLAGLFAWLPEDSHARLRNVQCEVLAARADRLVYGSEAEMAACAIGNLARLDFVGLTEQLDSDLSLLFRALALPGAPVVSRQNLLSSRRTIDLDDRALRRVLARQVAADIVLYRHVLARRRGWWRAVWRLRR